MQHSVFALCCVHDASQGQCVTDLLPVCELQGQAEEGRTSDLSLRIELISAVCFPQATRPSSSSTSSSHRLLSYFEGQLHFSMCLHASNSADARCVW